MTTAQREMRRSMVQRADQMLTSHRLLRAVQKTTLRLHQLRRQLYSIQPIPLHMACVTTAWELEWDLLGGHLDVGEFALTVLTIPSAC